MNFEDYYRIRDITDSAKTEEYDASTDVFKSLLREVKELSKKKPDATMSKAKVTIVNRVLGNLLTVLEGQPDAKYLEKLNDDDLPQVSDAVLIMVQFASALAAFRERYFCNIRRYGRKWVTTDLVDFLREEYEGLISEDEDDDLEE
ncbi:hypothetical protein MWU61_01585 [Loktanella sp. F6476L]|uniref:hypothetical protein n=1 Tax=Loktanella sp. F6476L TaxID=2926405 RepID=UPI001FF181BE|nr:hypothetical protein [Loktanella sp. F6476L]MCK0119215.1 hypothetical protein [Loktanella sp. F6476L]